MIDVLVATDFGRNLLLQNDGNFKFSDVSTEHGLDIYGYGMGIAVGDSQRRGALDFVVTNVSEASFFKTEGAKLRPLQNTGQPLNRLGFGWGIAFLDADNDGWPDLYVTNGHRFFPIFSSQKNRFITTIDDQSVPMVDARYIEQPENIPVGLYYPKEYQKDRFYKNERGKFLDRTNRDLCADMTDTLSVAVSDINRDGYDDFSVGIINPQSERGVLLYKNRGGDNHYVQIKLRGHRSNSFGVGSVITVTAEDGSRQSQLVAIGESFLSQNSLVKAFGLGKSAKPPLVEVRWPSGIVQNIFNIPLDQLTVVEEPES